MKLPAFCMRYALLYGCTEERCLIASYKITPVDTDTLSEPISPNIGILAR